MRSTNKPEAWILVVVLVAVAVIGFLFTQNKDDSPVAGASNTTTASPSTKAKPARLSPLEKQVVRFIGLYESPPNRPNQKTIRGLCASPEAYDGLNLETLDNSEAGNGSENTTVRVDLSRHPKFDIEPHGSLRVVKSSLRLVTERNGSRLGTTTGTYISTWTKIRGNWKVVTLQSD